MGNYRNLRHRLLAVVVIVGLGVLTVAAPAYAAVPHDEVQLTTNLKAQYEPAVDANRIIWTDLRNYDDPMVFFTDLYFYTFETFGTTKMPISGPSLNTNAATDGDNVVWQGALLAELDRPDQPDNYDIYSRNLAGTTQRRLTSAQAPQEYPAISGNRAVFQDKRHGNYDIYLRDLYTLSELQITSNAQAQLRPRISGSRVVYQDYRNGQWDIYQYDVAKDKFTRLTDEAAPQTTPDISGMKVVWRDDRYDDDGDIYMRDLSLGVETRLTTNPSGQRNPRIAGPFVVWEDYRDGPSPHIYVYDLRSGVESRLSATNSVQTAPDIHGPNAVWQDDRAGNLDIMRARLHVPALTVSAPATVEYQGTPTISANLTDHLGGVLPGLNVTFEKSSDGLNWTSIGTSTTNGSGRAQIVSPGLTSRTYLRGVCVGNASRLTAESAAVKVMPQARLPLPTASRIGTRKYRVTGLIQPRHTAGTKPIRFYMQYKDGDTWTTQGFFYATAQNFYSYSKCETVRTFSKNGSWRVRAYHEDWGHAPTFSAWRYITVH